MNEIKIGPIEPTFENGQRVAQMRHDAYRRAGMGKASLKAHSFDYKIGHATPEQLQMYTLPGANFFGLLESVKLANSTRRPLGAYVADQLVGVSQSGIWTPEDQAPFEARRERRKNHQIMDNVLGLKELMILDDEHLDENEIARVLLMDVMEYADGREVRSAQFTESTSPVRTLLLTNGFDRTDSFGRPVGRAKQQLLIHPSSADALASFASTDDI
jgi:hypothetical protein